MFKRIFLFIVFCLMAWQVFCQKLPNEIADEVANAKNDSSYVLAIHKVASFYRERDRDSAIKYINKAISICENNKQLLMKLRFQDFLANQLLGRQQFSAGYSLLNLILNDSKKIQQKNSSWLFEPTQSLAMNLNSLLANVHYNLQILMQQTSNWNECEYHLNLVTQYADLLPDAEKKSFYSRVISGTAYAFLRQGKLDSALVLLQSAEKNNNITEAAKPFFYMIYGSVHADRMDYENAKKYLLLSLSISNSRNSSTRSAFQLSQIYRHTNKIDSAYYYARLLLDTLKIFGSANYEVDLGVAYQNIYECFFSMKKVDSSFKYARLALRAKDSLFALRIKNLSEFQQMSFSEQKRLEKIETEQQNRNVRWMFYISIVFAVLIGFIAIILFRNARLRKRTNAILLQEKRTLEKTLEQLKSTQAQLVQSEKMASLGELTAGIAHEIQNPLNFVNNFSEVSVELLQEMKMELEKGDANEAKVIANDVIQNLEKITYHGKRADSIVKGMLQHSRSSTGQKELADINALCEEYLRLAYHGLRAKDKSFNANFEMKPDMNLPKLMVVQQEIGRVILNLISNAFYAVNERKKKEADDFIPTVNVITRYDNNVVTIVVEDNGSGIPQSVQQKIFQPFFTTKPAGQGTGLGLSLSYDIIKAHGGTIQMESKEGEGTRFSIYLPTS
jgi:two-component system, NtrC family, sensor kinase